jgi:uncharacterized protein (TIGR04255 family)
MRSANLTGKRYKKSPIIEAVCEVQFEENSSWDLAIPGLVYEKIRTKFPIRRQAARVTLGISTPEEQGGPQIGTVPIMQFLRKDEKALIQIGPNLLSVNILKPYPSWQKFLPSIKQGVKSYSAVVMPDSIHRIGLRYINQINFPGQNIKLEDYLEFRPFIGSNLPQDFGSFITGIQIPYENSRDILNLQLASLPNNGISADNAAIILSLDYVLLKPGEVALGEIFEWVEIAHSHIEEVFEASISETLRNLFEEITE